MLFEVELGHFLAYLVQEWCLINQNKPYLTLSNFHEFLTNSKITMAMYSPPTKPQIDPDIREDLLRHLDQEIQATQTRHDEVQRRLQHERR